MDSETHLPDAAYLTPGCKCLCGVLNQTGMYVCTIYFENGRPCLARFGQRRQGKVGNELEDAALHFDLGLSLSFALFPQTLPSPTLDSKKNVLRSSGASDTPRYL